MVISRKRAARAVLVTLALWASIAAAPAAAQAPAPPATVDRVDDASVVLDAQIDAYRTVYPNLSYERARASAEEQDEVGSVLDDLSNDRGRGFGGAWFEPTTGVLHVAVTNAAAERRAVAIGRDHGVTVQTVRVRRSVADLEAQADALRTGTSRLARAAHGQVGYDVQTNTVVVAVPTGQRAQLEAAGVPAGVRLVDDPNIAAEEDFGCSSRIACDVSIRAGAVLWRNAAGRNACSVGYTGRDSSGQRYTLTAGHCSTGNGVTWGTGTATIGKMQTSVNSGARDASIIRVSNSRFAAQAGGEMYPSLTVNGVAPTLSYISVGQTVCLAANFQNPTGPHRCGVVGATSDPAMRGLVRVNGVDACNGDSGGAWYWKASSTRRVAYGLHSRSDAGCNGSTGGSRSWFSALPTIKSWAPWLTIEVR